MTDKNDRERRIEALAEQDDALLEMYLHGEPISDEYLEKVEREIHFRNLLKTDKGEYK